VFFFAKKNQKTIRLAAAARRRVRTHQVMKSFFASSCSQKEEADSSLGANTI
jgi:hypothetical protein